MADQVSAALRRVALASSQEIWTYLNRELVPVVQQGLDIINRRFGRDVLVSDSYTVQRRDETIFVTGSPTVTLPSADGWRRTIYIIGDGSTFTLAPAPGELLDGSAGSASVLNAVVRPQNTLGSLGFWRVGYDQSASIATLQSDVSDLQSDVSDLEDRADLLETFWFPTRTLLSAGGWEGSANVYAQSFSGTSPTDGNSAQLTSTGDIVEFITASGNIDRTSSRNSPVVTARGTDHNVRLYENSNDLWIGITGTTWASQPFKFTCIFEA